MEALIGNEGIDQGAERDGRGWAKPFVWQRWTPVGPAAGGRVTLSSRFGGGIDVTGSCDTRKS